MRLLGIDATLPWNVPGYSDDPSTWRRHRQLRLDVWKRLEQLATAQAQHKKEHHEYHMTSFLYHVYYIYIICNIYIFSERCADCATQSKDPWSFTRCFFNSIIVCLSWKQLKHEYAWIHWWSCSTWLALTAGSSKDARSYNSNGRFAAMGREAWTWPLLSRVLCFWQLLGMMLSLFDFISIAQYLRTQSQDTLIRALLCANHRGSTTNEGKSERCDSTNK